MKPPLAIRRDREGPRYGAGKLFTCVDPGENEMEEEKTHRSTPNCGIFPFSIWTALEYKKLGSRDSYARGHQNAAKEGGVQEISVAAEGTGGLEAAISYNFYSVERVTLQRCSTAGGEESSHQPKLRGMSSFTLLTRMTKK